MRRITRLGNPTFQPDEGSMANLKRRAGLSGTMTQSAGLGFPSDAFDQNRGRPSIQPDQSSMAGLRTDMRGNELPFDAVTALLDNRNIPPQLRQVPYIATLASVNSKPQLLIPENRNRMSFILAYIDGALTDPSFILMSYGPPPLPSFGIPLPSGVPYAESNGSISIDDIYISPCTIIENNVTYPVTVIAYEGTLAIESLHNKNSGRL